MASASVRHSMLRIPSEEKRQMDNQLRDAAEKVGLSTTVEVLNSSGLTQDESLSNARAEFDKVCKEWIQKYPELSHEIAETARLVLARGINDAWR